MNEIQLFVNYYRSGSSTACRMINVGSRIGRAPYDLSGDDELTVWLTQLVARYVEAPLVWLWEWFLDRMDW